MKQNETDQQVETIEAEQVQETKQVQIINSNFYHYGKVTALTPKGDIVIRRTTIVGIVLEDVQRIREKIGKTKTISGGRELANDGLDSETKITVIKRFKNKNLTLLKVNPKNGRTNQIRLHLAGINHPIVGDLGYKDRTYFQNNPLTYPDDILFLHAHKINIIYNNTEKQFIAKIPEKFSNLIGHY